MEWSQAGTALAPPGRSPALWPAQVTAHWDVLATVYITVDFPRRSSYPCSAGEWKVVLAWILPPRTAWRTRGDAAAPCKGSMQFTRARRSPSALDPLGVAPGAYRQASFRAWFLCHLLTIAQVLICLPS